MNQRPPKSSAITFKRISTFVMDMMIPQGIQKMAARNTVGYRERQNDKRRGMIHATIQDDRRTGVGWKSTDADGTQDDRNEEDT